MSRVLGAGSSSVSSVHRQPTSNPRPQIDAAKSGSLSCPQSNINSVFSADDVMISMTSIPQTTPNEVSGVPVATVLPPTRAQAKGASPAVTVTQTHRRPKRPGVARRRSVTRMMRPHILLASVSETVSSKKPYTKASGKLGIESSHNTINKNNFGTPKAWMVNKSQGPAPKSYLGASKTASVTPKAGLSASAKPAPGPLKAMTASSKAGLASRSKHSKVSSMSRQEEARTISPPPSPPIAQQTPQPLFQHQQQVPPPPTLLSASATPQQSQSTPPPSHSTPLSDPTPPPSRSLGSRGGSRGGSPAFGGGGNADGGRSNAALHKRRPSVALPPKPIYQCSQFIAGNVPGWLRRPSPRTSEPLVCTTASEVPTVPPPQPFFNDTTTSAMGLAASKVMQHLPISPQQSFNRNLPLHRPRKRLLK